VRIPPRKLYGLVIQMITGMQGFVLFGKTARKWDMPSKISTPD